MFTSGLKTQITALSDADGVRCLENLMYFLQYNWSKTCFPCFSDARASQSSKFCNLLVYTASSKSESSLWMLWCLSPHSSFRVFFFCLFHPNPDRGSTVLSVLLGSVFEAVTEKVTIRKERTFSICFGRHNTSHC